ncbi:hypothetical protein [Streptomyces sp. CoH17]|uniref:hypothetical protein n=1 Tax=Streptomyces sp. CoH17 TaxID=2992806 RepID=UPI00226FE666|nr:hypothetical protein [Streptomyces sp. CoH17]
MPIDTASSGGNPDDPPVAVIRTADKTRFTFHHSGTVSARDDQGNSTTDIERLAGADRGDLKGRQLAFQEKCASFAKYGKMIGLVVVGGAAVATLVNETRLTDEANPKGNEAVAQAADIATKFGNTVNGVASLSELTTYAVSIYNAVTELKRLNPHDSGPGKYMQKQDLERGILRDGAMSLAQLASFAASTASSFVSGSATTFSTSLTGFLALTTSGKSSQQMREERELSLSQTVDGAYLEPDTNRIRDQRSFGLESQQTGFSDRSSTFNGPVHQPTFARPFANANTERRTTGRPLTPIVDEPRTPVTPVTNVASTSAGLPTNKPTTTADAQPELQRAKMAAAARKSGSPTRK